MTPPLDRATRQRELGAQAIGLLEVLIEDGDIPSIAVRNIAQRIIDEWDATLVKVPA
jgi:hypothetical protein